MAVSGNPYPTAPNPFDDIILLPIAQAMNKIESGLVVPDARNYLKVDSAIGLTYKLYPNCRMLDGTPRVVVYLAYNPKSDRTEFAIGPNFVGAFDADTTLF